MRVMKRRLKTTEVAQVTNTLYIKQSGVCPLCATKMVRSGACLDHDHDTGLVRSVLCRNCNGIEGKIKNLVRRARRGSPYTEYLGRVILYWLHHETDRTGMYHPSHKSSDEKREARNRKARERRARAKK
ncbi:recombination endonuclease VII [Stappia phage SI01]|uniref:Recombination endonuclease VII n=1 Tax=Stappia phage SI01 TaxID=2847766 RepID=A0AAE7SNI6_9CAUD|nr:recombination endonuclease VII [Stappia phage SI01]